MPTTQDGKKTGAAARAEQSENGSFVSQDSFTNPAIKDLTNTATAEDGMGVERIVIGSSTPFVPAPMEATDAQKEAAKKLETILGEAKEQRLAQLKGLGSDGEDVPSDKRAANEQYNAGSQTGVTSDSNATTGQANKAESTSQKPTSGETKGTGK